MQSVYLPGVRILKREIRVYVASGWAISADSKGSSIYDRTSLAPPWGCCCSAGVASCRNGVMCATLISNPVYGATGLMSCCMIRLIQYALLASHLRAVSRVCLMSVDRTRSEAPAPRKSTRRCFAPKSDSNRLRLLPKYPAHASTALCGGALLTRTLRSLWKISLTIGIIRAGQVSHETHVSDYQACVAPGATRYAFHPFIEIS